MSYVLRRAVHSFFLLAAVSLLSFAFASFAPGDFYSEMQMDPRVSAGTIARLRSQQGLDRPLPVRYADWAIRSLQGDFGYSLAYHAPVGSLIWPRAQATLLLAITATFAAWLFALPLGIWHAAVRGRASGEALKLTLSLLLSVPDLLLAVVLAALAAESGCLPTGGMASSASAGMNLADRLADTARHLVLPASVLALGMLPVLARHVRASMAEVMGAPFALNARALGIAPARILFRHLLPAALNPLLALFGLSLGTLLSASLLIEVVMGWPGLGPLFLDAIMARDFAIVLAVAMLSTIFVVFGNLASDLLLYRFDPRIRSKSS
jgi:peptide/nickel transport system permease protein